MSLAGRALRVTLAALLKSRRIVHIVDPSSLGSEVPARKRWLRKRWFDKETVARHESRRCDCKLAALHQR